MEELLSKINELYGIQVDSTEKVEKGFLSENYILIDRSKKYFLKKYRFSKKEKIEEIHSVKKYFASGGIPVILPLINKEQSTFFTLENKYFALFPFIEGRQLEIGSLTDTAMMSLGEMLGKIHLLGKEAKLPITEEFKGWDKTKTLKKYNDITFVIKEQKELSDFDKLALQDLDFRRSLIESNKVNYEDLDLKNDHLIHGDYHTDNVFFNEDDHVSFVFDFEKYTRAPRVFELMRSLVLILFNENFGTEKFSKAKLYLNSYLNVYPMSKEILQKGLTLYYLTQLHGSWVQEEHYLKKNYRVDQFLSINHERIKYLSENLEDLGKTLF